MHLKENKNEELIKIEENPSKPPPLPLPIFDNLNDLSKYPILQLLAADAYFSSAR
ncbi:unnamed protein product [Meloidogyne enterolobii]|uniref:Uncharacterized protein n=1 Tax=Meloidogyne enterolobii TaxID=390850 RepID=A0ACB0Y4Z2_MELEN